MIEDEWNNLSKCIVDKNTIGVFNGYLTKLWIVREGGD